METLSVQPSYIDRLKEKFKFLKDPNSFFYYVLLLIAVGFGFFAYALFTQSFTTPYSGDFAQQAYPMYYDFYDDWWTFFKTGQFPSYDSNTFLGADNVFANTYYGLFSPFTFPILFVPRSFIPHMMALISLARLVVGGLLFRLYLKYLGASEKSARIFSLAYAFMGWMAYYLWFNPFYEVLTFFPLILLGIEKVIKEKVIWVVSLGFFLLGISNYFFLLTMGFFGVAYAGFRYFQTIRQRNWKDNLLVIGYGFLGFLFGFGLTMFCVLPAVTASFSITRANEAKYLSTLKELWNTGDYNGFWKIIFTCWSANVTNWGNEFETYYFSYAFPVASYFYPPISDRFTNIMHYKYFENTGSSIFIYTPCMILMGVSIYRSIVNKKISHFIAMFVLIACLFIPFFYFLCGAFVTAYGRWEIVVPVAAFAYIALNYDHKDEVPWVVVTISGALTMACMIGTYFLGTYVIEHYDNFLDMGFVTYICLYEIVLCGVETVLFSGLWKKKYLDILLKLLLSAEIITVGTFVANIHSLQSIKTSVNGGYRDVPNETRLFEEINKNDNSYFRVMFSKASEGNTNLGMVENFNGMSTFHTFYNNDVDDFLRFSQVLQNDTSWSGVNFSKRTNLDEFLGVKYYVSKDSETMFNYYEHGEKIESKVFEPNIPLGYERIDCSVDGYRVYKNKYQIELGTSYDTIYYKNDCSDSIYNNFYQYYAPTEYVIRNEEAYYKGAILNNDDIYEIIENYGDNFTYEKTPPTREAKRVSLTFKGIYANPMGKYLEPKDPARDIIPENIVDPLNTTLKTNIFQLVYEPTYSSYFPLGEEGSYYMFDYPVRSSNANYAATVYLIGVDENGKDKVITFDNGRNCSRSSTRTMRGLYSKEPVKRIIVCVDGDKYVTSNVSLYYEPFENCIDRYQKAINNGLKDVTYNVNTFTFKTDYEKPRYVITQLAHTGGWRIFATGEDGVSKELKIYNSQGGFVGFVAPEGNVTYKLFYQTPIFKVGLLISIISLVGVSGVTFITYYVSRRKRKVDNKKEDFITL